MQILNITTKEQFYNWLNDNHAKEKECYLLVKRGNPKNAIGILSYLDAVECALCFGWIDSTVRYVDGKAYQRFSPRQKKGNWTELNKERCRRLIKLGLMTEAGYRVLPDLDAEFKMDPEVEDDLRRAGVLSEFGKLPELYQRIRASNLSFYRQRYTDSYKKMLEHTVEETKKGKTFGEWTDYGRLSDGFNAR